MLAIGSRGDGSRKARGALAGFARRLQRRCAWPAYEWRFAGESYCAIDCPPRKVRWKLVALRSLEYTDAHDDLCRRPDPHVDSKKRGHSWYGPRSGATG